MPDRKTTELPENTSLNNNDKIYHASAGGVSKFMRVSTLVDFIISLLPPSTGGDSVRVYLGRIAPADIPNTGSVGEYFINSDTKTYWQWTPDDSEDPEGPGSFQDTGDPVQDVEADTVPTLGSVNYVLSDGIYQALLNKANLNHSHSTSEAWLSDIINLLVSKTGFIDQLNEKVEQGTGISLSIVGGKLRISASGTGAEAGDFVSIGGLPLDNLALAAEFAKYQKPPVWTPVTPSGGVVTLPAVNGSQDYYEWTESGPDTLAHSGTFKDAGIKWARVTLSSASYTITLGGGYVDKEGVEQTSITLTGTAGRVKEFYLVRKGSTWIVYEDAASGDAINLPIDISDVTGLQAELDDLQDQIDGLVLTGDNEYQEYANVGAFPGTGETDLLYVAIDTGFTYRWSGSAYVQIGGSTFTPASNSEIDTGTNNTKSITALGLSYDKTQDRTIGGKRTFSSAPRLSSTTASLPLKVNADKDVISEQIKTADVENNAVTNQKLAQAAGSTVTGNPSSTTANKTDWEVIDIFGRNPQSGNYTVLATDTVIAITSTASPRTMTIGFAIASVVDGHEIYFKDESAGAATNNITIAPNGTDTIETGGTTISTNGGYLCLYANKTSNKWQVKYKG